MTGGMEWMNAYVAPVENMGEVKHEQHVINLATEAALDAQESLEAKLAADTDLLATKSTVDDLKSTVDLLATKSTVDDLKARLAKLEDDNNTLNIAVAALALAATALGVISLLCVFRVSNKKQVAHTPPSEPWAAPRPLATPPCHAAHLGRATPCHALARPRHASPRLKTASRVGSSPTPSRGCPSSPTSLPSRRSTPRSRAAASRRVIPPLDKAPRTGMPPRARRERKPAGIARPDLIDVEKHQRTHLRIREAHSIHAFSVVSSGAAHLPAEATRADLPSLQVLRERLDRGLGPAPLL